MHTLCHMRLDLEGGLSLAGLGLPLPVAWGVPLACPPIVLRQFVPSKVNLPQVVNFRALIGVNRSSKANLSQVFNFRSLCGVKLSSKVNLPQVVDFRALCGVNRPATRRPSQLPAPDRKVDIRLPGKEKSNSHGARPVYESYLDDSRGRTHGQRGGE